MGSFQIQSNIHKINKRGEREKETIHTWRQSSAGSTSLTFLYSKASLSGCKISSAWVPSNARPADARTSVIGITFATDFGSSAAGANVVSLSSFDTSPVSLLRL